MRRALRKLLMQHGSDLGGARAARRDFAAHLARFMADRKAAGAIEFALILPLLLCMYLATVEISQAIAVDRKLSRATSMIADLIGQRTEVSAADLEDIVTIAKATLQPYNRSDPKANPDITITAIQIDANTPRVAWSFRMTGEDPSSGKPAKDSTTTVPDKLNTPGSFLIKVEGTLDYQPVLTWSTRLEKTVGLSAGLFGGRFTLKETYHARPRQTNDLQCDGC
jgi:Flp pilus assembly protein TadG